MTKTTLTLAIATAFSLAACGGTARIDPLPATTTTGTTGTATTTPTTTTPGAGTGTPTTPLGTPAPAPIPPTGFTAPMVPTTDAHYLITQKDSPDDAALTGIMQNEPGGATAINNYSLTGASAAISTIAGNNAFAMGRWSSGTATTNLPMRTIDQSTGDALHYVAYNTATAFPVSGTLQCNTGTLTSPSYVSGGAIPSFSDNFGHASGSAGLSFSGAGAVVTLTIGASTPNYLESTAIFDGTVSAASPALPYTVGTYPGAAAGAKVAVGKTDLGYLIATAYRIPLQGGRIYTGVATFLCK